MKDFDDIFDEFDKVFAENGPFHIAMNSLDNLFGCSGYTGYSGFSGYSGMRGYSGFNGYSGVSGFSGAFSPGPKYSGHSYVKEVKKEEVDVRVDDFDSGPAYEKKPFKITIPKYVYYIFGIVATAGITILLLTILESYLKGRL